MTTIKDLEEHFEKLEGVFATLKRELEELKEENLPSESESLLGRWATTSNGQRVLIISDQPDEFGMVTTINKDPDRPRRNRNLVLANLDVDPVVLTTEENFDSAPKGTIAVYVDGSWEVYVKTDIVWQVIGDTKLFRGCEMPTCRVIRWGDEE